MTKDHFEGPKLVFTNSEPETKKSPLEKWRDNIRATIVRQSDRILDDEEIKNIMGQIFLYTQNKKDRPKIADALLVRFPELQNFIKTTLPKIAQIWDKE